jgi:outer membrane usher protein
VQGLLRQGLTDYQYSAGFLRPNAFSKDDRYGNFGWVGRYRFGVTDDISAGVRFEGTSGVLSGGPTVDIGTRLGSFHLGTGVSRSGAIRGAAADFAWGYSTRRFGLGANLQYQSDGYSTTSLSPQTDRAISSSAVSGSYSITPRTSFSVQLSHEAFRDSGTQSTASAFIGLSLGDLGVTLGAARNIGTTVFGVASSGTSYFFTMMLAGKARGSTMLATTAAAGKTTSTLQLQEGVPTGIGFGYRAAISNDPGAILTGDARYNGAIGTYDLSTGIAAGSRPDATLTVAGGIAEVDGKFAFSRPLTGSFALVEVPGQSNVHVSLNGQDMGVTNRAGYLIVPDAVPYYDNRVRIDARQTSFDTVISDAKQEIAPGIRSGALVRYGVRTIVAFTGKVLIHDNRADIVPAAGDFTLSRNGKTYASDLGNDGEFYFENLTPGEYGGIVRYAGGTCRLNVNIAAGSKVVNDVGTLVCDRIER